MFLLVVCIAVLVLGYFLYSRLLERALLPLRGPTPAVVVNDGMDYVPMSKWKDQLIELLNIAGTGPIFGALMGAKWGPVVVVWIVAGTILGGAVHDYMSGMMSERNGGKSTTWLIKHYMGERLRYPILAMVVFVLVMVAATFARSATDLLVVITDIPAVVWISVILIYFVLSAILPINKVIGRIYPVFGVILILMAVTIFLGLMFEGYQFPAMTLENLHPTGENIFPDMFITVACGAISGFHATQSPMVARCLKDERDGRMVFYGAMVIEAVIALLWALAGLTFYYGTPALADALASMGASGVVYDIATGVAGPVGGLLAVVGVLICPITSGDTAVRSARMMIQDDRGYDNHDNKKILIITAAILVVVVGLCTLDFTVLWNYFAWLNQSLACIVLWTATAFILRTSSNRFYSLITALPALFMTSIVTSFIIYSPLGLGADTMISTSVGAFFTVVAAVLYMRALFFKRPSEEDVQV